MNLFYFTGHVHHTVHTQLNTEGGFVTSQL